MLDEPVLIQTQKISSMEAAFGHESTWMGDHLRDSGADSMGLDLDAG